MIQFCFVLSGLNQCIMRQQIICGELHEMNWTGYVGSLRSHCSHRRSRFMSLKWTKLGFITEEHTGVLSQPELHAHVSVTCWGIIQPPRIPDWEEARFTMIEKEIWRTRETEWIVFRVVQAWGETLMSIGVFYLKLLMCLICAVWDSYIFVILFYEEDLHDQYELLQTMLPYIM